MSIHHNRRNPFEQREEEVRGKGKRKWKKYTEDGMNG